MRIDCRSYAKINWSLEILGRRPDGYHEVHTLLQTIDLHDRLQLEATAGQIEIICDRESLPTDESNLIHRAARRLRQMKAITAGVRIRLDKRIPIGAGLGGGSSNAAVTLLALQRLWSVRLEAEELFQLGAELGADVPFFFYGGTALGLGRGADVYPLPDAKADHVLLVWPRMEVSTRSAYEAWSKNRLEPNPSARLTTQTLPGNIPGSCAAVFRACEVLLAEQNIALSQTVRNDLEPVVLGAHPEMREVFERLRAAQAKTVRMSGSGSAVYAVFDSGEEVEGAMAGLADQPWQLVSTRTVGREEYRKTLMSQ
jgi:4-diphosphocytidyl-2-C-methyl-D-erythritol kinase